MIEDSSLELSLRVKRGIARLLRVPTSMYDGDIRLIELRGAVVWPTRVHPSPSAKKSGHDRKNRLKSSRKSSSASSNPTMRQKLLPPHRWPIWWSRTTKKGSRKALIFMTLPNNSAAAAGPAAAFPVVLRESVVHSC